MDGKANEASVEQVIEQYLDGRGRRPEIDNLDQNRRAEVTELMNVADLLWQEAHQAPALARDPVAAMLGLVPDPAQSLDPVRLKQAMKSAKIAPAGLAAKLAKRGWQVSTKDVFSWTTKDGGSAVPPALIRAVAEEIHSSPENLISNVGKTVRQVAMEEVTETSLFQLLAERWSQLQHLSIDGARQALAARLVTTVHRGDVPDSEQMLQSLRTFVEAFDEGRDEGRDEP